MPSIATSFSRWIFEKIIGDGFGRLFDYHMFTKDGRQDMNSFSTSPTPREIAFGVERTSYPPSSSIRHDSVDSSISTPGLTRCNSLATCASPSTPSSTFSPSAFPCLLTLPNKRRPSGENIERIFYCEKEILAAVKEQHLEGCPFNEAATTEEARSRRAKTHWIGYTANAPECIMAPSHEMIGEGCYRISKMATFEQVLDSFSACQGPMGPIIATFAGKDRKVPGHDFTYHELSRALYERSTAAATKKTALDSYTIEKNEEGTEVQRGFPFQPGKPTSTRVVPGHVGADWHSPLPHVKEWDFVHNKGCPGAHGAELARIAGPRPQRPQRPQQPANVPDNSILKNGLANNRSTRVRVQVQAHVRFAEHPQFLEEPQEDSEEDEGPPQDIMVERVAKRDSKPAPKLKFVATRPKAVRTVTVQRVPPQRIFQASETCKLESVPSPKVYNTAARYHPGAMVRIANPNDEDLDDALESCS